MDEFYMVLEPEMLLARAVDTHVGGVQLVRSADRVGDCSLASGDRSLIVELKRLSPARLEDIEGTLSRFILMHRPPTGSDIRRALILVVARASERTTSAVGAFVAQHDPALAWGILDEEGSVELHIPDWSVHVRKHRVRRRGGGEPSRRERHLFSDLNRWMLKILLLADDPPDLWGGRNERPAHATALARIAAVSVEKAHRLVRALRDRQLLRETDDGMFISNPRELLMNWLAAERLVRRDRHPVRWALGAPPVLDDRLARVSGQIVIGGFEACRRLGVLHVGGSSTLELHVVNDLRHVEESLDLVRCEARDADIFLLEPAYPQSVLRGSLHAGMLRHVDIIQAALDVCDNPARGVEQAEFIVDRLASAGDADA